jgi:hypothetical protein
VNPDPDTDPRTHIESEYNLTSGSGFATLPKTKPYRHELLWIKANLNTTMKKEKRAVVNLNT